ncbi:hypothetical protein RD792_009926 [Penstemon davidsonii]|uniref:Replication factor C subunit 1 n=1 Tax=Penstemon davidsonii TaxID=160366 RepID=A0ABR0D1V2_9LAMI|nr:hypothetical protein RD792_009926 [Penstemon davidsonii]
MDIRKWFMKQHDKDTENGKKSKQATPSTPEKPPAVTPQPGKLVQGVQEGSRRKTSKYFAKDKNSKDEMEVEETSMKRKSQKVSGELDSDLKPPPGKKIHKLDDEDEDFVTPISRKGSVVTTPAKKLKSASGKGVSQKLVDESDEDNGGKVKSNSRSAGRGRGAKGSSDTPTDAQDMDADGSDEEDIEDKDVKSVKSGGRGRGGRGASAAAAGGRGRGGGGRGGFNFGERKDPPHKGEKEVPEGAADCLNGLTFVISGTLDSLEREEAEDLIKRHVGRVTGSVSKKTNYLLCDEDIGGRKSDKAKELGTAFLTEDGLFDMIRASNKSKNTGGRGGFNFGERKDPPHKGEKEVPEGAADCLNGLTFVISGTLDSLEREEAEDLIKRHGGRVTGSVSKKTNYLLCDEDIGGRKSDKAKELGTAFLTEDGLFDMIRASNKSKNTGGRGGFNFGERKDPPHKGEKEVPEGAADCLNGLTFVISGTLDSLEREEAEDLIKRHGGRVTGSVSKKTNYLLCDEDIGGRKSDKAKELGTAFLTEDGLFDMIRASNKSKNTGGRGGFNFGERKDPPHKGEKEVPEGAADCLNGLTFVISGTLDSSDIFLLSGTPGIGKTTSAKVVCQKLGFQTIEVNASDNRGKADAKIEKGIGGSTSNSIKELVSNEALSLKMGRSQHPKTVLIMDEVDGMSGGDRVLPGFPDNVRTNEKGEFWVAIHCRRTIFAYLSAMSPKVRKLLLKLPISAKLHYLMQIGGRVHAVVVKYSPEGKLLKILEDRQGKVVKAISEVEEKDGKLWTGSVLMPFVAVYELD